MAQQQQQPQSSTSTLLYPRLETSIAPLEKNDKNQAVVMIERQLVSHLKSLRGKNDILDDLEDKSILPLELMTTAKRTNKPKVDPLKKLKELPTDDAEEEDDPEDEEEEDDQEMLEDEEEDAGGDYLVSHFDNGENFEDNDDDGDDMTSMM